MDEELDLQPVDDSELDLQPVDEELDLQPVDEKKDLLSKVESSLRGIGQGVTANYSDEIMGAMAAAFAKAVRPDLFEGQDFKDIYKQGRDVVRGQEAAAREANPGLYTTGEFAGAVASPVNKVIPGGLVTKATGLGALYGSGASEAEDLAGLAKDTAIGGALGAGIGKGVQVAAPLIGKGVNAATNLPSKTVQGSKDLIQGYKQLGKKGISALEDTISTKGDEASSAYGAMRDTAAKLTPASKSELLTGIDDALAQNRFIPALNPKTLSIVEDLKDFASKGDLDINQLDQYRKLLGKIGQSEDGIAANSVKRSIDDFINKIDETKISDGSLDSVAALKSGREAYHTMSKYDTIADLVKRSNGDPDRIKTLFKRFTDNSDNLIGFTDDEINALKEVADSGLLDQAASRLSKFGIQSKNTLAQVLGGFHSAGGLTAAGTITSPIRRAVVGSKVKSALDTIEKGGKATLTPQAVIENPQRFGKFANVLLPAAQKGGNEFAVKSYVLQSTNEDFRRLIAAEENEDQTEFNPDGSVRIED